MNQDLTIEGEFSSEEFTHGVYAVQIMEFKENMFSAKVLDSSDIEISSEMIQEETMEKEFEIDQTGSYKLVIQSNSNEETRV